MQAEEIIKMMNSIVGQAVDIQKRQQELGRIVGILNRGLDIAVEAFSAIALQKTGDQKPWEVARDALAKIGALSSEIQ